MPLTTIEDHHQKWSDLPLFTHERWVVTDDGCVLDFDVDLRPEPWPADHAAELLTAWTAA